MATTKKMKNLANCKPSEFLSQTNKIRKAVSKWLTLTDIQNIRKRMPTITDDMSDAEIKEARSKQQMANFNAILESVMEVHPNETLEVLALASFVDPSHVDDYTIDDYLDSFTELMQDKSVMSFLTSLMQLGNRFGLTQ